MPDDLVSIVIPTYNRADLLPQAVESALNQKYENMEVIIVDDGSTDTTLETCKQFFVDPRVTYFFKSNGGIGSALNFGVRKMRGQWFKWLSSDDYLEPDAVELLLSKTKAENGRIVYASYFIVDENNERLSIFLEEEMTYLEFSSELTRNIVGNGSSVLIHKSCFDEVGLFDEELPGYEDYDWWLRACWLYNIQFFCVEKPILNYRVHSGQITTAMRGLAEFENVEGIKRRNWERLKLKNPVFYSWLHKHRFPKGLRAKIKYARRQSLNYVPKRFRKDVLTLWFKFRGKF